MQLSTSAAPGEPSGARLPAPLPRPSGAGKQKELRSRWRDQFLLPCEPSPAPVAPSRLALRCLCQIRNEIKLRRIS